MPEYICTMGPSILNSQKIVELYNLGLRTIRFNMSHIDYDINEVLQMIKRAEKIVGHKIYTMLDTCGTEIRINTNTPRQISIGDTITLEKDFSLNVPYRDILEFGDILKIDDGKVIVKVISKNPTLLVSLTNGKIKNGAGVFSEKLSKPLPFISEKDYQSFQLAFRNNMDWVACSFVKSKEDIKAVQQLRSQYPNCNTKIMAKIETREAIEHLDEIISLSDGIMIARGDLGVAFPVYMITSLQNYIAGKVISAGIPLTIGTGFLRSMKKNPLPEKAEVSDLYYAFTLTNSIMFSGETAVADDPISILKTANSIFKTLEIDSCKEKIYEKNFLTGGN